MSFTDGAEPFYFSTASIRPHLHERLSEVIRAGNCSSVRTDIIMKQFGKSCPVPALDFLIFLLYEATFVTKAYKPMIFFSVVIILATSPCVFIYMQSIVSVNA